MKKILLASFLTIGCLLAYQKYSTPTTPSVSAAKKCGQFGDCLKMAMNDMKWQKWTLAQNSSISEERIVEFMLNQASPTPTEKAKIEKCLGVNFN